MNALHEIAYAFKVLNDAEEVLTEVHEYLTVNAKSPNMGNRKYGAELAEKVQALNKQIKVAKS